MVRKVNEARTPMGGVYTLEEINELIIKMKNQLQRLSSVYANADDISSRMIWTSKMKSKYQSAYQSAAQAYKELSDCVAYMIEFETDAEVNFTEEEDWE